MSARWITANPFIVLSPLGSMIVSMGAFSRMVVRSLLLLSSHKSVRLFSLFVSHSHKAYICHPERSEGSGVWGTEMLSAAKHDTTSFARYNSVSVGAALADATIPLYLQQGVSSPEGSPGGLLWWA
jgi:hypothetical protein